jgi:hypothetical protein
LTLPLRSSLRQYYSMIDAKYLFNIRYFHSAALLFTSFILFTLTPSPHAISFCHWLFRHAPARPLHSKKATPLPPIQPAHLFNEFLIYHCLSYFSHACPNRPFPAYSNQYDTPLSHISRPSPCDLFSL